MTLVLTINSPETIWLLADRRLSFEHRKPKDDAHKIMCLDTTDGVAILGYAGLGATARGTQPANWMSAVLRGRNLSLEQCLEVLTKALNSEFPRHMVRMPRPRVHCVLIPAFVGGMIRLYEISLLLTPDNRQFFRYTRHVVDPNAAKLRTPRLAIAGSGAVHLSKNKKWIRPLLRMVKASDRGQVRPIVVADHLARLNHEVHLADKLVGPRCIVVWHQRKGSRAHTDGGGAHQYYSGTTRDRSSPALPSIGRGLDIEAIVNATMGAMQVRAGERLPTLDMDVLKAAVARIADKPDEKLR